MGEQQKMTIEEAIAILDPETSRAALFGYRYFGGFRGSEAVLAATEEACRVAVRVMREYNIDVTYYTQEGGAISDDVISENVNAAVGAFKKWQAEKMGRDVNPSYLIQLLMQAGVKRVEVRAPAFATVKDNQVAKIGTTTVTNGGAESE